MDNKAYLEQIAQSNRPIKQHGSLANLFSSKLTKILFISIAALIVVIIAGSLISGSSASIKDKTISLKIHFDGLIETLKTYQSSVKSPALRAASASLSSISENTSASLSEYLTAKYNLKDGKYDKKLQAKEDTLIKALDDELFEAKISSLLDRTFARKIAYEISLLSDREQQIYHKTNDSELKTILQKSFNSLDNLYDSFNDFSETK